MIAQSKLIASYKTRNFKISVSKTESHFSMEIKGQCFFKLCLNAHRNTYIS